MSGNGEQGRQEQSQIISYRECTNSPSCVRWKEEGRGWVCGGIRACFQCIKTRTTGGDDTSNRVNAGLASSRVPDLDLEKNRNYKG